MQIKQLISGGVLGAESAALDVAIQLSLPYGGITADTEESYGFYRLVRRPVDGWLALAEANMELAEGVLIFTHGELTADQSLLQQKAECINCPCYHIDFKAVTPFQAGVWIDKWTRSVGVAAVFVTGSRLKYDARIIEKTEKAVYTALMLGKEKDGQEASLYEGLNALPQKPKTVDEAVRYLVDVLSLKNRVQIAKMTNQERALLNRTLGNYIRRQFRLERNNDSLMADCAREAETDLLRPDEASALIITKLALELEKTHKLRSL